jgi:prolipoprotein diacylglyceryl transferase
MLFQSINWNPSPILVELGPIAIRYYSLMFVFAFLIGIYIEKKIYKNDGVSEELVDSLFIYGAVSILLGARLGDVFFYSWDYYQDHLLEILLPIKLNPFRFTGFRGLASHGAATGMIIAMFLYQKKKLPNKSMLWILDRVVLAIPIGGALVRFGNLMNSEIIGKYTHTDYGFIFKQLGDTAPRHPAQIYEALSYLLLFVVLWYVYWKTDKRQKEGYLFGIFMLLLWTIRFFIEFVKEAQEASRDDWMLNTGQLLSIPMVLVGLYFMFRSLKKKGY